VPAGLGVSVSASPGTHIEFAIVFRGEQSMAKKTLLVWGIAFIVGFYTTFVLQSLWNWFAVPAL